MNEDKQHTDLAGDNGGFATWRRWLVGKQAEHDSALIDHAKMIAKLWTQIKLIEQRQYFYSFLIATATTGVVNWLIKNGSL